MIVVRLNPTQITINNDCYREAYTLETQNLIRKQRNEIDQLEKEKKELLKDLRLAESRSNQNFDESNAETLKSIVDARGTETISIMNWYITVIQRPYRGTVLVF